MEHQEVQSRFMSSSYYYHYYRLCYPTLEAWNGDNQITTGLSAYHRLSRTDTFRFCANASSFVTATDIATLSYKSLADNEPNFSTHAFYVSEIQGNGSRESFVDFMGPFHVKYTKVRQYRED